jgi:hypothetical protein
MIFNDLTQQGGSVVDRRLKCLGKLLSGLVVLYIPLHAGIIGGNSSQVSVFSLPNPICNAATCDLVEGRLTTLPFIAFAGDVILLDEDGSTSDVVRFFNNVLDTGGGTGFGNRAQVYSKIDVGPDYSVGPDLGIPDPPFSVNATRILEAGLGSATVYNGNGTLYSIYSDVPEPSDIVLLSTGLLTLGGLMRKRPPASLRGD